MASHTRSVFSASRMVLPGRISLAMAAEWVMPEQPMRLDQGLLDDAVLDVEGQLAGALLRRAPADAVRQAGDVLDFLGLHPFALFGDGRGTVVGSLRHADHFFNFAGILHGSSSFSLVPCFMDDVQNVRPQGFERIQFIITHENLDVNRFFVISDKSRGGSGRKNFPLTDQREGRIKVIPASRLRAGRRRGRGAPTAGRCRCGQSGRRPRFCCRSDA